MQCRNGRNRTQHHRACSEASVRQGNNPGAGGPTWPHLFPFSTLFLPLGMSFPFLSTLLTFSNKKFPTLPALLWTLGALSANTTPLSFQSNLCMCPSEHCMQSIITVRLAATVIRPSVPWGTYGHLWYPEQWPRPLLIHIFYLFNKY